MDRQPCTLLLRWLSVALLPFAASLAQAQAPDEQPACASTQTCVASCARFKRNDPRVAVDPRLPACETFCRTHPAADCAPAQADAPADSSTKQPDAAPVMRSVSRNAQVMEETELNGRMLRAIGAGDLRTIRRLIEDGGLDPTYVYAYEFNPETRKFEGRPARLRLAQLFGDRVESRSDNRGLDQVLMLLLELGMDVKATVNSRTAWGPSLKFMEQAADRESRFRAFDLTLQRGLRPNDDISEWLFAELPQTCGRDQSAFAIRIVDLLISHLGSPLQDEFWRAGERGPETLADVLDRMMAPANPSSVYKREQFEAMDSVWENCVALSRRINRFLMEGK